MELNSKIPFLRGGNDPSKFLSGDGSWVNDTKDNTVSFTSDDTASPTSFTTIDVVASGEKHSSLMQKLSQAIKNIRWFYKPTFTDNANNYEYLDFADTYFHPNTEFRTLLYRLSNMSQAIGYLKTNIIKQNYYGNFTKSLTTEPNASWNTITIPPVYRTVAYNITFYLMGYMYCSGLSSNAKVYIKVKDGETAKEKNYFYKSIE